MVRLQNPILLCKKPLGQSATNRKIFISHKKKQVGTNSVRSHSGRDPERCRPCTSLTMLPCMLPRHRSCFTLRGCKLPTYTELTSCHRFLQQRQKPTLAQAKSARSSAARGVTRVAPHPCTSYEPVRAALAVSSSMPPGLRGRLHPALSLLQ